MRTIVWTVVFTAAVVAACTSDQQATAPRRVRFQNLTVSVDSDSANLASSDSQLVKGWGLDPGVGNNPFWHYQGPQAESLLYHMGLTFIRDQLDYALYDTGTTISNITLNSAQLTAYETKWDSAKVHGMGYMLSVWSPPARFKDSIGLDGGKLDSTDGRPSFVAFMTVLLNHLNSSTVGLPKALSIANEPDKKANYPSTPYDTALWEETLDNSRGSFNFAGYSSMPTIGPELSAFDSALTFLGDNSDTTIDGGYFYHTALSAYAFHTYGDDDWSSLQSFINNHKKDVWMTEYSQPLYQGNSQVAKAIDLMSALGAHFEIIPTNYWAWWLGSAYADTDVQANGSPGAGTLILDDTLHNRLEVTSMFYTLRKLFQNVIPGSWRVQYVTSYYTKSAHPLRYTTSGQESSGQPRIDVYAFEETDSRKTVVVVSNWTNDDKRLTLIGLPTSYTTQQGYVSDSASTNAELIAQSPSTCWTPTGQSVARTVLYAPHRGVLIAIMNP